MQINLLALVALASVFLYLGCKKDPPKNPEDPVVFRGNALLNGSPWEFTTGVLNLKNDSIFVQFSITDQSGVVREKITFNSIPLKVQSNILTPSTFSPAPNSPSAFYATVLADGDVLGEMYVLDEGLATHHLDITKFETTTDEMEGNFEATLIISPLRGKVFPSSPDTLKFRNGVFRAKIFR